MKEFLSQNFIINVALGQVNGASILYLAANNEAVDVGSYAVLWHPGGTDIIYPASPQALSIVSTSAEDTNSTGTGAWEVEIKGLNSNYEVIGEKVLMNGITGVNTKNQYIRCLQMRVSNAGTTKNNVGSISAKAGANIICHMDANDNRSSGGVYTVPNNHIFLVYGYHISAGGGKEVHSHIEVNEPGYYYEMRDHNTLLNVSAAKNLGFCGYLKEKSDLRVMAKTLSAGAVDVSGSLYGLLINIKEYRGLD